MTNITISIIEKVKKELNITEDVNVFDLHKLLFTARKNSHPDLFEEESREKAKEKFQILNELYSNLKIHISSLRLEQNPSQLAIYEKSYEEVLDKSRILELESNNERLQTSLNINKREIEKLKKEIQKYNEEKSEKVNSELVDIYKPKSTNYLVLGISALLIFIVNILSQITNLKESLLDIFPFGIQYLNYLLFGLLIFFTCRILLKNWKSKRIQKIAEELKSSKSINRFYQENKKIKESYYSEKEYFLESDIEEYISWNFMRRKYRKSLMYYIESIFQVNDLKSINYLKDIFIYNLIVKGYIKIGTSKKLDREFLIE